MDAGEGWDMQRGPGLLGRGRRDDSAAGGAQRERGREEGLFPSKYTPLPRDRAVNPREER